MTIEVIKPGLLTTFQDAGRRGFAHLGIGRSGAFDESAWRIANALCGNAVDVCALEITLLGPTLRFHAGAWIAVTGAPVPFRVDGVEQPAWAPVFVAAGATLEFGAMRTGCRSYLAVRGGFDVLPVLGSRSTDVNAALGPNGGRPLRTGDVLTIGSASTNSPDTPRAAPKWRLDPRPWWSGGPQASLRLLPATHLDQLTEKSRKILFSEPFNVELNSNRVGVRLTGPSLECSRPIEMISEGCVPGLVQLPPSGQPIAFGPECPVSGGYPRIGQIAAVDIARLAQLRPGDALRFVRCTLEQALDALRKRERAFDALAANIAARLAP
ncbi:MAG TPA: biotin-dependent carboxyltransferase family protein [Rhodanobacteraceae bacterium]|nr:biotin-dependent carboxyltransferase family protein [Rhodanobacteraceae bacterium]